MALEFASRPEDIGPLLRAERRRRHWPLKKVAAEVGMAISSLSDVERGANMPSIESLFALCKCLELSLWLEMEDPGTSQSC